MVQVMQPVAWVRPRQLILVISRHIVLSDRFVDFAASFTMIQWDFNSGYLTADSWFLVSRSLSTNSMMGSVS